MKRNAVFYSSLLLVIVLLISACAPAAVEAPAEPAAAEAEGASAPMEEKEGGGTLQVCFIQATSYAHLAGFVGRAGSQHFYQGRTIFSGLVQLDHDVKEYIPELAESWEFDGNRVIFHLRNDVTWHDGTPFTSKDVLFNYGRLIPHPLMVNTAYNGLKDYIVGYTEFKEGNADSVSGITAPDDYTVVFEMTGDYGMVGIHKIAAAIRLVPEHILSEVPEDQWGPDESGVLGLEKTDFATTKAIGTGPFMVDEYVPDQYIIYSPNPDYFRGAPKLDQLIYRSFNGDPTAMMVATEAGECDWVIGEGGGRPVELQRLAAIEELDLEIFNPPANVSVAYWWNLGREHIQNPLIRQGIQHAINGEQFNQVMASGVSRGARVYLDGKWGINPDGAAYITYDPELAKQKLTEGGWDFDNDKLILVLGSLHPAWEPLHLTFQQNMAAVGVTVEFKVVGADYGNVVNNEPYEWDLLQAGDWAPWFGLLGYDTTHLSTKPWYDRAAHYAEEVALLKSLELETDDAVLKEAVWQIQESIGADPFGVILYAHINPSLRSTRTRGCDTIPSYYYHRNNWNLEQCWIASE
ncbi:MAG: ABC transporter substrate-binding protein [Caldilineaceae bacterium SB0670_bin_27]|uniref:ABC transporter substrate-binding protein n=1 Tax=Caldilineaceae bacterium SB0664_bin_27 TaxID=2605260 RepID=A0A6B0YL96_9CHLR|nr:ABC transporter substrate-binding protein [Caldilineaceae bacterium SB0664_bin_27]MYJ76695.1 ABC transporter substrate-binding protein [Caldilineaceae bacterium SB0670_bin_27]